MPNAPDAPSTPPASSPPSSTPPGTTTTPALAAPPAPSGPFRFGDQVDDWARGKTAEEVYAIAKGYHEAFTKGYIPERPAPASPQPAYTQAPPPEATFDPDAVVTGKDMRAYAEQYARQNLMPQLAHTIEQTSSAVYGIVSGKHAKEFGKYGPEINQELARVPKHLWTLDNLNTIVDVVRGRHTEELARERAQELLSTMEPTIRPTGGGAAPVPDEKSGLESEKIPADWKVRAKQAGITEATVREFCQTNEMTPEDFFKLFESPQSPIVAEASAK